VGDNAEVISNALNAVALNAPKITVFTNGPLNAALNETILSAYPAAFTLLAAQGIPVDQRTIARLEQIPPNANNETIQMVFSDGTTHTTNSLLWRPPFNQTNSFAKNLGLAFNTNNLTILAAANGSTSVKGVYSAGDASSNLR
jgi:thioredoxin reductase